MPDELAHAETAAPDENPGWAGCALFAAVFLGGVLAVIAALIAYVRWNLRDF